MPLDRPRPQKNSDKRWKIKQYIGLVLLIFGLAWVVSDAMPEDPVTISPLSQEVSSEKAKIKIEEISPLRETPNQIEILKISSERIFADLEALTFERYSPVQREKARGYIIEQLQSAGWLPQEQVFEGGVNLYADRPGTDPAGGIILVGAHYDTVAFSPGADDNATGVATVLEISRLLASRSTARSLRVAFFDQEESGLWGSLAFSGNEELRGNLKGAIAIDMIGYACHIPGCQRYPANLPVTPPTDKGDFIVVVGDVEHLPLLNAFNMAKVEGLAGKSIETTPVLTLPIPLKGILMPDTLRSDHAPFWYQGIGAVLVTDTANLRNRHYHMPTDVVENIDRKFFLGSAQLILNATTALLESGQSLETFVERS